MGTTKIILATATITLAAFHTSACGPWNPIIPTPEFFGIETCTSVAALEEEENLRGWQALTSPDIPLEDIRQAVYADSYDTFLNASWSDDNPSLIHNHFYNFIRNTDDQEIIHLLLLAKRLEQDRAERNSPWYYPAENDPYNISLKGDLQYAVSSAKSYGGYRMADRYALQAVRALFASRRFGECVEFYDSAFADVPASNLMKRMASRYVAGAMSRMGDTATADTIFALSGDFLSISRPDAMTFMASLNPDAPQLMEYIRSRADDSTFMAQCVDLAHSLLKDNRVKAPGDWVFLMAYDDYTHHNNLPAARRHIAAALRSKFSSEELADLARAFRMKLDAQAQDTSSLLRDLKWIETKTRAILADAPEWESRIENIIYQDWIPGLWKAGNFPLAIRLAQYADFLNPPRFFATKPDNFRRFFPINNSTLSLDEMRSSEEAFNVRDYKSLSFQMMESLPAARLISTVSEMRNPENALLAFLGKNAPKTPDFYYDIIGTIALREENYPLAIQYLSLVGHPYQRTTNIFKGGYLASDPFKTYPSRLSVHKSSWDDSEWVDDICAAKTSADVPQLDAKLTFARRMNSLKKEMKMGATPDIRGKARLEYAIGRRNSLEQCWALTQFYRGGVNQFEPKLDYWEDNVDGYSFLYDYIAAGGNIDTEKTFEREARAAIDMMTSPDAKAEAEYRLGNLKTVITRYPDSPTANIIKTSCDNWSNWL